MSVVVRFPGLLQGCWCFETAGAGAGAGAGVGAGAGADADAGVPYERMTLTVCAGCWPPFLPTDQNHDASGH